MYTLSHINTDTYTTHTHTHRVKCQCVTVTQNSSTRLKTKFRDKWIEIEMIKHLDFVDKAY